MKKLRVLPVLDVLRGEVVRGVGGRREEYRPIQSQLASSSRPLAIADGFRRQFGLTEIYVADLDAIQGGTPAIELYRQLGDAGYRLWVDAGLRRADDVAPLAAAGVHVFVAGLETLAGPDELRRLCACYGPERIVFSLDLRDGRPLGDPSAWGECSPHGIAAHAFAAGVRRMILLDLARVGLGSGTGTEPVLRQLSQALADVEWIVGGGVREAADLARLETAGAAGVLVASAFHDGRLRRDDLYG